MIVARLADGRLARGERGASGTCPGCGGKVYGREPDGVVRHWAHNPDPTGTQRRCDSDNAMTEWHRRWLSRRTDLECIEVTRGDHRADVINAGGFVVEFQHSPIREDDVRDRESFWRKGVWVLDGTGRDDEGCPRVTVWRHPDQSPDDPYRQIRWPRPPHILGHARWPLWVDLGDARGIVQLRDRKGREWSGHGWIVTTEWFISEVVNGSRPTLREHKTPGGQTMTSASRKPATARRERDEDLTDLVRHCAREPSPLVAALAIERPVIRVQPRTCVYGCPGSALLYPSGWRCAAHAPQRIAS